MIFQGDFFYDGIRRWNLGWATPNYAGAFLATCVVWLWALPGGRRTVTLGVLLEGGLYFLACKTYSRGALLAIVVAAAFQVAACGRRYWTGRWRLWPLRAALLAACVVGTGFAGRLSPVAAARDLAVTNRLELWRGGLRMIAAAPLRGWGAGESGRAYMNWFQDPDRTEGYATMVNSYLQIGVEYGLARLGLALLLLSWCLLIARSGAWGTVRAAAGASIAAWATANVFSTLWIEPGLWVVPAIGAAVVVRARLMQDGLRSMLRPALPAMGIAIGGVTALWAAGERLSRSARWKIEPGPAGTVSVAVAQGDREGGPWQVWADTAVLGRIPGAEIRRWLAGPGAPSRLLWHDPNTPGDIVEIHRSDGVMLIGGQAGRFSGRMAGAGAVVFVLPRGRIPDLPQGVNEGGGVTVILPEIDEWGANQAWRDWADASGARQVWVPGVGGDIRAAWPQAVARWITLPSPARSRNAPATAEGRPTLPDSRVEPPAPLRPRVSDGPGPGWAPAGTVAGEGPPAPETKAPGGGAPKRPAPGSMYWNAIRDRLGGIMLDGTLHCSLPLGESPALQALGFDVALEHAVETDSSGRARTVWHIPALATTLAPEGRRRLEWRLPGGGIVLFDRTKIGRSLAPAGTEPCLIREGAGGVVDIRTPTGWAWHYRHGCLVAMEHPALGAMSLRTQGGLIREIRSADDAGRPPLLTARYDAGGHLLECSLSDGPPQQLIWDGNGQLTDWKQGGALLAHFSYRDGLLAGIEAPGRPQQVFSWTENPGWRRGDSKWPAPVRLRADSARAYSFALTPAGFVIGVKVLPGGRDVVTTFNPLRLKLEQCLPDGGKFFVTFHRRPGGIGTSLETIANERGETLERYYYDEQGRMVALDRRGAAGPTVLRDGSDRSMQITGMDTR